LSSTARNAKKPRKHVAFLHIFLTLNEDFQRISSLLERNTKSKGWETLILASDPGPKRKRNPKP
jgi:hypothetical protein